MVNGRTNISMKTNFLIILMLMNIPVLLYAHLPGGVNHILNGYPYTWMALKNRPSPGPRDTTFSKFFHRKLHFSKIITLCCL